MLTRASVEHLLQTFPRLRIGLLGDLFLDRYLELAPGICELSIETGLEAYQIPQVRNSPGALGTVLNNLAALGVGKLVPVTVLGDDGHGYDLRQALHSLPVDLTHVVVDAHRLTPTYTKPLRRDELGNCHELNRLDVRSREPLSASTIGRVINHLREVFHTTDGLIVLDQVNEENWGVVHREVRDALAELQRAQPQKLTFIDSRRHLGQFQEGVLKGNRTEILAAWNLGEVEEQDVQTALEALVRRTSKAVFCTVGEQGIYVAAPQSPTTLVAGRHVTGPIDIVGAGDSATSGIVTALLSGFNVYDAAAFGNLVASITVQQLGTTGTASPAQVRAAVAE